MTTAPGHVRRRFSPPAPHQPTRHRTCYRAIGTRGFFAIIVDLLDVFFQIVLFGNGYILFCLNFF